jgi:tetratricopeptide (TPR) repeat protein
MHLILNQVEHVILLVIYIIKVYINKAIKYYRLACKYDNNNGYYNLAKIYRYGNLVQKDYDTAIALYKQAYKRGHTKSLYHIAYMYFQKGDIQRTYNYVSQYCSALSDNNEIVKLFKEDIKNVKIINWDYFIK